MLEVILKTELITSVDICLLELGLLGLCRWEGKFRVLPNQEPDSLMVLCLHECGTEGCLPPGEPVFCSDSSDC